MLNRLRGRIAVQADGQMKTGRDVVIAALLGADEFGFATAPLVVEGCIMMRKCHLNTCPVGIATQDPELVKRFAGQPEHVINYFFFVAEEVREHMARMGFRTFAEMVGRVGHARHAPRHRALEGEGPRLLARPPPARCRARRSPCAGRRARTTASTSALDHKLIADARPALAHQTPVVIEQPDPQHPPRRRRHALGRGRAPLRPRRAAGRDHPRQAARHRGAELRRLPRARGHARAGGRRPTTTSARGSRAGASSSTRRATARSAPEENIIVGNTVLYGATAGEVFFRGVAGERFAVRNSGATAVVEGCGDHGCEYMTGGTVVVLGKAGRNFAAGMSGGVAYVLDATGDFAPALQPLDGRRWSRCSTSTPSPSRAATSGSPTRSCSAASSRGTSSTRAARWPGASSTSSARCRG